MASMTLSESTLRWAIDHLLKESDTDLYPRPFELVVIAEMKETVIHQLSTVDINQYQWNSARRFLIPKDNMSYRNATQLNQVDTIILSGILYDFGNLIENKRQPDDIVFSYRFNPTSDGTMYSNKGAWENFWRSCRDMIASPDGDENYETDGSFSYVVTCDISDFYNQIYLHAIENQLISCGFPNQVQKRITELIKNLNISVSRGIPVGPHASHLLAEMSLIPIDNSLILQGITFKRYVDDFVFFCKDEKEARKRILQLAEILDKEQRLTLQRQKTHIYTDEEFLEHCNEKLLDDVEYDSESEILNIINDYTDGNAYQKIKLTDIEDEDLETLSEKNIVELLSEYLKEKDYERLRWLYRRLTQLGIPHAIDFSIENFQDLIPAINDMCLYINSCAENYKSDWKVVGEQILELLNDDIVQNNTFYQITLLNLFVHNKDLNHIETLITLFRNTNEDIKRKILLSTINYPNASWIHQMKEEQIRFSEWTRRAYLIATKSLPADQKKFLHRDILSTLHDNQLLEKLILKWAK
jgi:hypothetical protein